MSNEMSSIMVYGDQTYAPVRTVTLTLRALEIPFDVKVADARPKGESIGAIEKIFNELNPHHNVCTIDDGGFVMNESRAIVSYLVNAYGKDHALYRGDSPKIRAKIDQRLYVDSDAFYKSFGDLVYPAMKLFRHSQVVPDAEETMRKNLTLLNHFLQAMGDVAEVGHITIADYAFLSTCSSIAASGVVDLKEYPFVNDWFKTVKGGTPKYWSADGMWAEKFGELYKSASKE